ncbi:MAG: L,D-transpeptidase family protein [Magnetococcales bacterium]|nr:L,D-transpeptidase family protein [Magnetococcales bacterium]
MMNMKLKWNQRSVWMVLLVLTLAISGCESNRRFARSTGYDPVTQKEYESEYETTLNVERQRTVIPKPIMETTATEKPKHPLNVQRVIEQYDHTVRHRLTNAFKQAGLPYPSPRLALLAFKQERRLELWGGDVNGPMKKIKIYPFTAFSGELGPKRREGDRQIPEGFYRITFLNPDSAYHLSMKLDYPNPFDRAMAEAESRKRLGGDIFIHGDSYSIGCIALGDVAIEELFVLTAMAGLDNVQVIVSPYDLRREKNIRPLADIPWTKELYIRIQDSLLAFNQ